MKPLLIAIFFTLGFLVSAQALTTCLDGTKPSSSHGSKKRAKRAKRTVWTREMDEAFITCFYRAKEKCPSEILAMLKKHYPEIGNRLTRSQVSSHLQNYRRSSLGTVEKSFSETSQTLKQKKKSYVCGAIFSEEYAANSYVHLHEYIQLD